MPSNSIRSSLANEVSSQVDRNMGRGAGRPGPSRCSDRAKVDRRDPAPLALLELVADLLSLLQPVQSGALDRRDMHKDVVTARRGLDKAKTLLGIEPFNRTARHPHELQV